MKSIRKVSLFKLLVLLAGAMGASAMPAHAQNAKGAFTLAHTVRWGTAVLPAGDYVFTVDTQAWPARVMVHDVADTTSAIILPQTFMAGKVSGGSTMVLRREGEESVVSRLMLGNLGLALEFNAGKGTAPAETATLGPIAESQPGK